LFLIATKSWMRQLRHPRDLGTMTYVKLLIDVRTTTTYVSTSTIAGRGHARERVTATETTGPIRGY
jgi:hypothetical protein